MPPPHACSLHPAPADPIGAWIDAGMAEVRPDISNAAYAASHSFVADWRTHRVWDYLNGSLWKFIPSDERVLDAQVRRAAARGAHGAHSFMNSTCDTQYAHHTP